jgi:ADP-heptose:LPS heptosyltransferase
VREREPEQLLRHEVRRQLDLAAEVGWHIANERLRLCTHPATMVRMQKLLQCAGIGRRPWILVNPGAGTPSRRYPERLFAQVVARLTYELGLQLVFTGSNDEVDLIGRISAGLDEPGLSLAGRLSVADLAALINLAPLLLTNNAGPAHLAAALCTPVVVLYALTHPQQTPWHAPYRVLFHDVPCRYCFESVCPLGHHRCLAGIEPDEVVGAVDDMLSVASWPAASCLPAGGPGGRGPREQRWAS